MSDRVIESLDAPKILGVHNMLAASFVTDFGSQIIVQKVQNRIEDRNTGHTELTALFFQLLAKCIVNHRVEDNTGRCLDFTQGPFQLSRRSDKGVDMGLMADQAGIQFRLLNRRKGPAVQGPRAQIDRNLYRQAMQKSLREIEGLTILAEPAADIIQGNGRLIGVETEKGTKISCGALVITTGTFLRGEIHLGGQRIPAGRVGEAPSIGLANSLYGLGLRMVMTFSGQRSKL